MHPPRRDSHATDKRRTRAVVRSNQEIRSQHVAIEAHAALEVRHRNPEVMQSGQVRTITATIHDLDGAIDSSEVKEKSPAANRGCSVTRCFWWW
jgi:hypothetical protein